ncbi:MAG: signal peptidase I [Anaerolineae bacterium]
MPPGSPFATWWRRSRWRPCCGSPAVRAASTIVEGSSMEPNFFSDEWVMVNKLAYRFGAPQRGDVIVFHAPDAVDKDYIKRVIGLPGETVQVREGAVYVDGLPIQEPWLPRADRTAFGPYRVPEGHVFVLGDNRPESSDSRLWPVAGLGEERIVGKVWLSVWPRRAWGVVPSDAPPAGRRDQPRGRAAVVRWTVLGASAVRPNPGPGRAPAISSRRTRVRT